MKKLAVLSFIFVFIFSAKAQEKGSLMHYQKKGSNCLVLAGEKYDASKFNIVISSDAYSGGTIRIKCIEQGAFKVKKALLVFGELDYKQTEFYVKGKKNIRAFENWAAAKLSKDPNGNTSMRVINGKSVTYSHILKGRKLYINIQTLD